MQKFRDALNILFIAFILALILIPRAFDDTDDSKNETRSGMGFYIDRGTGCHYVGGLFGGMHPRYSLDGKQICRESDRRK